MRHETNLRSIDYSALTAPILPSDVQEFEAELRGDGVLWSPRPQRGGVSRGLIVATVIFVVAPLAAAGVLALLGAWPQLIAFGPACVATAILAVFFIVPAAQSRRRAFGWEQHYRLSRFAWENGIEYRTGPDRPDYKGVMFDNLPALVMDHLTSTTGTYFDVGNLAYGTQESAHEGNRGFLAVHLGGALPQIILDAKANNGLMGGLGTHLAGQPTLSLEGDFDRYFTLYCPPGYERDALYIFTPDLMADLIDESHIFDVELRGEWMFAYSMTALDLTDPALLERMFRIVRTVAERAAKRSSRYRDDLYTSLDAAAAKPQGNRIPVSFPRRFGIIMLLWVASVAWIPLAPVAGALLSALPH